MSRLTGQQPSNNTQSSSVFKAPASLRCREQDSSHHIGRKSQLKPPKPSSRFLPMTPAYGSHSGLYQNSKSLVSSASRSRVGNTQQQMLKSGSSGQKRLLDNQSTLIESAPKRQRAYQNSPLSRHNALGGLSVDEFVLKDSPMPNKTSKGGDQLQFTNPLNETKVPQLDRNPEVSQKTAEYLRKIGAWRERFKTLRFFFDLDAKMASELTKTCRKLGASVESFLSADVTHLITSNSAMLDNDRNSLLRTPSSKTNTLRGPTASSTSQGPIERAKSLNIKIWPLKKLQDIIATITPRVSTSKSLATVLRNEKMFGVCTSGETEKAKSNFQFFEGYYLLVEDFTARFKPVAACEYDIPQDDSVVPPWPTIHYDSHTSRSVFDPRPVENVEPRRSVRERQGVITPAPTVRDGTTNSHQAVASFASGIVSGSVANLKPRRDLRLDPRIARMDNRVVAKIPLQAADTDSALTNNIAPNPPDATVAAQPNVVKKSKKPKIIGMAFYNREGYCENCNVTYKQFAEHVQSKHHLAWANNPENFNIIDPLLKRLSRPLVEEGDEECDPFAGIKILRSSEIEKLDSVAQEAQLVTQDPNRMTNESNASCAEDVESTGGLNVNEHQNEEEDGVCLELCVANDGENINRGEILPSKTVDDNEIARNICEDEQVGIECGANGIDGFEATVPVEGQKEVDLATTPVRKGGPGEHTCIGQDYTPSTDYLTQAQNTTDVVCHEDFSSAKKTPLKNTPLPSRIESGRLRTPKLTKIRLKLYSSKSMEREAQFSDQKTTLVLLEEDEMSVTPVMKSRLKDEDVFTADAKRLDANPISSEKRRPKRKAAVAKPSILEHVGSPLERKNRRTRSANKKDVEPEAIPAVSVEAARNPKKQKSTKKQVVDNPVVEEETKVEEPDDDPWAFRPPRMLRSGRSIFH